MKENDIYDVISKVTPLELKGKRYVGLCPFHKEETPSFAVCVVKKVFHCFGCGVGGDVNTFQRMMRDLEVLQAMETFKPSGNLPEFSERSTKREIFEAASMLKDLNQQKDADLLKFSEMLGEFSKPPGECFWVGLDLAKRSILEKQFVIVVKYRRDWVPIFLSGILNCVCSDGLPIEEERRKVLRRYADEIVVVHAVFDDLILFGDKAASTVTIPNPYSITDFLLTKGVSAFRHLIQKARDEVNFPPDGEEEKKKA